MDQLIEGTPSWMIPCRYNASDETTAPASACRLAGVRRHLPSRLVTPVTATMTSFILGVVAADYGTATLTRCSSAEEVLWLLS